MKKLFIIAVQLLILTGAFAQSYWIGGTPGRETEWSCPQNWLDHRVPGPDDEVVIAHLGAENYPVITEAVPAIAYLEIEGGARVTIAPNGRLVIENGRMKAPDLFLIGAMHNRGQLFFSEIKANPIAGSPENLINEGTVNIFGLAMVSGGK